jgi:aspartate beta-hydroxylase
LRRQPAPIDRLKRLSEDTAGAKLRPGRGDGQQAFDGEVERVIAFLEASGADTHPHARGRSLLDHLIGTYEIVRRWDQPGWLQLASLVHSVYGTDAHREQLIEPARRAELVGLVGERAERIAYLFCVTPRGPLWAGTYRWSRGIGARRLPGATESEVAQAERPELDALVMLHMANLAEQVANDDGAPGLWLFKLRELAELLLDCDSVTLPLFVAGLAGLTARDERAARQAYREALSGVHGPEAAANRLAFASAVCPVVAEPCIWLAHLAHQGGDPDLAREWARCARRRLVTAGTTWDKRLNFEAWMAVIHALERASPPCDRLASDPRHLFEQVTGAPSSQAASPSLSTDVEIADGRLGKMRFQRYMDLIADGDQAAVRGAYPDLSSRPWYDRRSLPLARSLEAHFTEIKREVLALDPGSFQREAERIPRDGKWDVVFFYERGRRHDEVCEKCPVATRVIESAGPMRTAGGLIYVSRMRAGTHIGAHRGPTNLRLRCHLGISVPEGDCAIRVGEETRRWSEGECLIFSDYFEHEAWNHSGDDRIVLIVDLWHPALSQIEVDLLAGLHRYAHAYGSRLSRYWAANTAAAAAGS